MDKLRTSYTKHQTQVFMTNPRLVSSERATKLTQLANNQMQQMTRKQDFKDYEEASFYKQKFSQLAEVAAKLQNKQISEQRYHKTVREIMQNNFLANSRQILNLPRQKETRTRSKSPLGEFFEQEEAKKSKAVSFSKLLAQQQTPLKFKLRAVARYKSPANFQKNQKNNEEIRLLEEQNRKLREKINNQKYTNTEDQARLRELRDRLCELNDQNRRLKSEISRSQKSQYTVEEEYDPYNIKVRQNNIVKIHNKNLYMSEKMSQLGSGLSQDFNMQRKSYKVYYDNQSDHIRSDITPKSNSPIKKSNYQLEHQEMMNASQSTIQTQFLNLQDSELYDDQKNQLCRQKIAFFKKSMVLLKNPDFDIAFKRSDFNYQMDKLRLILYVNNKTTRRYDCTIEYQYERDDYDILVRKRLVEVNARSQGRQQIEISLKNSSDLGSSVINAKILIGDKMKKVLVPALFIDFDSDYKYQFQNVGYLERNLTQPLVIKPMTQFNTIDRTSSVIQMVREYQQKYEVGKLYGKSKACKGIVKLTWKKGKIKIQTCEQWRTLIGYLLLNAQQTLTY